MGGDDQLTSPLWAHPRPYPDRWCTGTHAAAGMIPVNVLSSRLMLVVSVGPRPANSRPANSTREYEPGSGESHDPAPVHHPHPARSPPAVASSLSGCAAGYVAAPPASRVLRIADATGLRPALDPGASAPPGAATTGRPTTCPRGHRRTPKARTRQPLQADPRGHHQQTSIANTCPKPATPTAQTTTLDQKPVDQHPAGLTSRFI